MTKYFKKSKKKKLFLTKFEQKWIFPEVFRYSDYLPLNQKAEKPNEPFLRKLLEGQTKIQFIPLISSWDTANLESCDWLKNPAIWIFPNMKFV